MGSRSRPCTVTCLMSSRACSSCTSGRTMTPPSLLRDYAQLWTKWRTRNREAMLGDADRTTKYGPISYRRWGQTMAMEMTAKRGSLTELLFLRLGLLGFGGPVALVGQMERELVAERGWLTKEQMREAIAICQSLPGPLAIQVGIYISYLRGGFWGAWCGGWAFIFPNFVIVAALGALYVYFGDLKPITGIFYGVSPAVIALILHSCWRLSKLGMEDKLQWAIAAACLVVTVILQA